ncbi:NAD(P)/FAD-dependent oxidoreductase [Streptomyces aurantiacus]|uniref:Ferredoxin reductase n=1 Tax=Streptomyces aurantiacus TaxID=47760 RepID=A0A7G1PGW4_9ACTN|nr:FAD-dependent oxidoreductase [Streptomyces aurantiacus]BCL33160.1 ferredoxin reductase [Streptomyces aurantiacus]
MPTAPHALVIGASAAGLAAADGLRDGGWEGDLTVLGAETHPPYDRPMLSKRLLSGAAPSTPLPLRTEAQLTERRIDLHLGHRAMGLDIDRRLVVTDNGAAVPYDVLVIATGSRPRPLLTSAGETLPALRDLDDLTRIRELTATGEPVAIVGTGFIGLEVAAALRQRGVDVEIFGRSRVPMEAQVGDEVGRWLRDLHESRGVRASHGVDVDAVHGRSGDYRLVLDDHSERRASVVLAGVGVDPADTWLRGSGVARRHGVLSDPFGRTSAPQVWVAGEVANIEDPATGRRRRFDHWTNAVQQGRTVGMNAAGRRSEPLPHLRSFWTEQYGHVVRVLGERRPGDTDVVIEGDVGTGTFVVLHTRGAEVHGVTSCGFDRSQRAFRTRLIAGGTVAEFRAARTPSPEPATLD